VGWRGVFGALALFGVVLWLVVWRRLPETLPAERRRDGGLRTALAGYRSLLRDGHFVALAVLPGLVMAVLFAYVVGSPFALREEYGLSTHQFALLFAVNGAGLVAGAQVNASLVRRMAPIRILRIFLPAVLVMTLALCVVIATDVGGIVGVLVVLFGLLSLINFIAPNASALALGRHGEVAGTAAAFIGCLQAGVAGAVSPLVGVLGGDARAMALVMAGSAAVAFLVLVLATPAYRRGGWHAAPRSAQAGRAGEPAREHQHQ
jgi:DHA1 family bicyclomycin/chloramphenicol resistance-like MFS transporter